MDQDIPRWVWKLIRYARFGDGGGDGGGDSGGGDSGGSGATGGDTGGGGTDSGDSGGATAGTGAGAAGGFGGATDAFGGAFGMADAGFGAGPGGTGAIAGAAGIGPTESGFLGAGGGFGTTGPTSTAANQGITGAAATGDQGQSGAGFALGGGGPSFGGDPTDVAAMGGPGGFTGFGDLGFGAPTGTAPTAEALVGGAPFTGSPDPFDTGAPPQATAADLAQLETSQGLPTATPSILDVSAQPSPADQAILGPGGITFGNPPGGPPADTTAAGGPLAAGGVSAGGSDILRGGALSSLALAPGLIGATGGILTDPGLGTFLDSSGNLVESGGGVDQSVTAPPISTDPGIQQTFQNLFANAQLWGFDTSNPLVVQLLASIATRQAAAAGAP